MKEVAVLGAGAAGLVASRHLVGTGCIRPTIFEASSVVGGAWNIHSSHHAGGLPGHNNNDDHPNQNDLMGSTVSNGNFNGARRMPFLAAGRQGDYRKQWMYPKMWPNMQANLSKFSCCFSDFPWSNNCDNKYNQDSTEQQKLRPKCASLFPTRQEIQDYLGHYSAQYLTDNNDVIWRQNCRVQEVSQTPDGKFQITWVNHHHDDGQPNSEQNLSHQHQQEFDGVVVATGFFTDPIVLPNDCREIHENQKEQGGITGDENAMTDQEQTTTGIVLHSSDYIIPNDFENKRVAVIGASLSAFEIAADLAPHTEKLVHVMSRIPYVLPRYLPFTRDKTDDEKNGETFYLPLDMVFYKQSKDDDEHIPTPPPPLMDQQARKKSHTGLRHLVGSRQANSILGLPPQENDQGQVLPPFVAISDNYIPNLETDKIQVIPNARLEHVVKQAQKEKQEENDRNLDGKHDSSSTVSSPSLTMTLDNGQTISGLDAIICCTGYKPRLDFLHENILNSLGHRPNDAFCPLELCHDILHPNVPGLAFVGMYRGPYFGVMELQARLAAQVMSSFNNNIDWCNNLSPSFLHQGMEDVELIRSLAPENRTQFPRFNYVGLMETLARELNLLPRVTKVIGEKETDFVCPVFYQTQYPELAQEILEEMEQYAGSTTSQGQGENPLAAITTTPHVVLRALVGQWTFERTITHYSSSSRSHHQDYISGTIQFTFQDSHTVRYREDGVFQLPNGKSMQVFREYEYIQKDDALEIYFVEGGKRAHLFLRLVFQTNNKDSNNMSSASDDGVAYKATSEHLCVKDLYRGTFGIIMDGLSAQDMTMTYRVKGPEKNYEAVTRCRPT